MTWINSSVPCFFEPCAGCRAPRVYAMSVCGTVQCRPYVDSQLRAFVPCVHSDLLYRLHAEPLPGFCA
ncbi:hypothetical protein EVAR_4928_1 [Eumeta japonica]|uniref:Uncharacterized protein n=1 Tax=Eumeta variegata TaxID=151549 RepID=A0A4C1UYX4_EUMVA|nr:hypothetical protein EVAR_4928_1 [Eumeta japonica]